MKKRFLFVAAMFLMAACCFGQKFVAGGYAYVDASSGLRVRSDASLGAKKIGVVYDRMKVKVIEVGPKVTIDGISSNWIRILLPVESIKERRTVSGWVFGGYLTEKLKPFSTDGWTDQDLILYMCRFEWRGERYLCNFKQTRECSCGLPESSFGGSGSYKVSMINKTVDMKFEFGDDSGEWSDKREYHYKIISIEEDKIVFNNGKENITYIPAFYSYDMLFYDFKIYEKIPSLKYDDGWIYVLCYEFGQNKLREFAKQGELSETLKNNCKLMGIDVEQIVCFGVGGCKWLRVAVACVCGF